MSVTLTVRLPEDLADWLTSLARKTGLPVGGIVRRELEKAKQHSKQRFLRHAGAISGPKDLSSRKGFARR
jgi:predicted DNA-binding protein